MATAYRFIIEQRITNVNGGGGGRMGEGSSATTSRKTPSKKGTKTVTLLGSMKGGVEHNRKLRAINPLLNKATHGYWEKGMRLGRAGLGLVKFDAETGAFAGISGVAVAIIISMAIQTFLKIQNEQREHAKELNNQNFNLMESGVYGIRGDYQISVNMFNSRATYNQNK